MYDKKIKEAHIVSNISAAFIQTLVETADDLGVDRNALLHRAIFALTLVVENGDFSELETEDKK